MRVIAGTRKGTRLKAVPGKATRPTTDKVKEALFNMIGPFFDGGRGLDLFSGSGGLGIEALSRGFDSFIFVDRAPKAVETIKTNLVTSSYMEVAEVFRNDARRALKAIVKRGLTFDVIFLDPPYSDKSLEAIMQVIAEQELLKEQGVLVVEHDANRTMADTLGSHLVLNRQQSFQSQTAIAIYQSSGGIKNG